MDKRTTGIIATIAAVLLCGLSGLFSVCIGFMIALVGFIPGAEIDMFGSSDPQSADVWDWRDLSGGIIRGYPHRGGLPDTAQQAGAGRGNR